MKPGYKIVTNFKVFKYPGIIAVHNYPALNEVVLNRYSSEKALPRYKHYTVGIWKVKTLKN